jgi:hypothetical protein
MVQARRSTTRSRGRRWARSACAAAAMATALVGCGTVGGESAGPGTLTAHPTTQPSSGASGPSSTTGATAADPLGLVGLWTVTGTEAAGTTGLGPSVLRLAARDLASWRGCRAVFGSWRADHEGLFLAGVTHTASGGCGVLDRADAGGPGTWLTSAARFRADGDGWQLLDRSGAVVAELARATTVRAPAGSDASLARPPVVDDEARRALAEPAPLPAGLEPASSSTLVGRWGPAERLRTTPPKPPFLQLRPDRSWTSSDGCNGSSGRWAVGHDGRVLVTAGASTLIGCQNVDLAGWWGTTARAGFDGPQLVLLDRDGRELARLTQTTLPPGKTHGPVTR